MDYCLALAGKIALYILGFSFFAIMGEWWRGSKLKKSEALIQSKLQGTKSEIDLIVDIETEEKKKYEEAKAKLNQDLDVYNSTKQPTSTGGQADMR
jgi:hypothetical protein